MFLPEYDHFPFLFPQVTYQSDQFLDKNKDYVVAEHQELLNASKCPFVSGLFPPATEENTKSSKSSIATRFKVTFIFPIFSAINEELHQWSIAGARGVSYLLTLGAHVI